MIKDLIMRNRSYRRFYRVNVKIETLRELVELARLSPSAANLQPLKYIISCNIEKNALVFPCLKWAAYLKGWKPLEEESPSAYIIILGDKKISSYFYYDAGIAAQSILLGAVEKGLGGCIIASIDRKKLRENLGIDERYEILLVIAIGKPKEKVVIEEVKNGNIKYWRDENGIHHVPKRSLDEIIIKEYDNL